MTSYHVSVLYDTTVGIGFPNIGPYLINVDSRDAQIMP